MNTWVSQRWPFDGGASPHDIADGRRVIHRAESVCIESFAVSHAHALGRVYTPKAQIVFPYFGVFDWRIGREPRLIDANSILRIAAGQDAFETHPLPGFGHGSIIMTPAPALLDELRTAKRNTPDMPVARPMSDAAKLRTHRLAFGPSDDPLAIEETALDMIREAVRADSRTARPPSRLIERAKHILHDRHAEPVSLDDVARETGVTPNYLTQAFRRAEGMPLYRYQLQLRLSRALVGLRSCESITTLALDLGFSSHSHFTAAFSSTFGVTPSAFRRSLARGCSPRVVNPQSSIAIKQSRTPQFSMNPQSPIRNPQFTV